jgi:hypothetical protein
MKNSMRLVPALALVLAVGGCSMMGHSDQDRSGSSSSMHRADATQPANSDPNANCAPDTIGSAAGQGSDCRHGTGGAATTPPDSSNSNEPNAPTSPPR